jgi:predicted membrane protein (TIGR00267 family)
MLIKSSTLFDFNLALRVAVATLVSGGFVFFVAKYAELRGQLLQAEKELNLASSGKLATTALGRKVLLTAINDAIISGSSAFIGAFLPLLIAAIDPYLPWLTLSVSIAILAIFGFILGKTVGRYPIIWSFALIVGGGLIVAIGIELHIID